MKITDVRTMLLHGPDPHGVGGVERTWHVLLAAEQRRVTRVVYFSSAQVFGCAEGEGSSVRLTVAIPYNRA